VRLRKPTALPWIIAVLTSALCHGSAGDGLESGAEERKGVEERPAPCDTDSYHAVSETHFVQRTIVTLAKPSYPAEALKRGVEGSVSVDIVVDKTGSVVKACALNGPELLRRAAEKGALACKLKENFGSPTPVRTPYRRDTLPYLFVLDPAKKVDEVHHIVVRPTP
jgi:hypothetical protein